MTDHVDEVVLIRDHFSKLVAQLREANSAFDQFFKEYPVDLIAKTASNEIVDSLRELVLERVQLTHAFSILARIDPEAGLELILARYLGCGVNPDKKYGGYTSELGMLFEDLLAAGGDSILRKLFSHPRCDQQTISDPRVEEALSWAFECTLEEAIQWIRSNKNVGPTDSNQHQQVS